MMRPQRLPVASPRGGNRGCLCKDGHLLTQSAAMVRLQAQGIGALVGQGISVHIRGEEWQTINTRWEATNTLWQDL
jgi:hypothetical protein